MTDPSGLAALNELLDTAGLPALGPQARDSREQFGVLEAKLRKVLDASRIAAPRQDAIRALVFLWHDYLDQSHSIAQELHNADGSYIHGMMHRREPDYWNSKYWFNRVGKHPAYELIGSRVDAFLKQQNTTQMRNVVVPNGKWSPGGFVDLCETAAGRADSGESELLQRVQEIEFRSLLEHLSLA